jgi:hypothetical protein
MSGDPADILVVEDDAGHRALLCDELRTRAMP